MSLKTLVGSGSGIKNKKIRIRIRNKSFRIRNPGLFLNSNLNDIPGDRFLSPIGPGLSEARSLYVGELEGDPGLPGGETLAGEAFRFLSICWFGSSWGISGICVCFKEDLNLDEMGTKGGSSFKIESFSWDEDSSLSEIFFGDTGGLTWNGTNNKAAELKKVKV